MLEARLAVPAQPERAAAEADVPARDVRQGACADAVPREVRVLDLAPQPPHPLRWDLAVSDAARTGDRHPAGGLDPDGGARDVPACQAELDGRWSRRTGAGRDEGGDARDGEEKNHTHAPERSAD